MSFQEHLCSLIFWEGKQLDENSKQSQDELEKVLFYLKREKLTEEVACHLKTTVTAESESKSDNSKAVSTINTNISKLETEDETLKDLVQLFTLATGKRPSLIGTEIDLEETSLDPTSGT